MKVSDDTRQIVRENRFFFSLRLSALSLMGRESFAPIDWAYTFYCFVIHLHTNIFKIRLKKQCGVRHRFFELFVLTLLFVFRINFTRDRFKR